MAVVFLIYVDEVEVKNLTFSFLLSNTNITVVGILSQIYNHNPPLASFVSNYRVTNFHE